jgi:hypothetical protein
MRFDVLNGFDVLDQHGEFVAAETGQEGAPFGRRAEPLCDSLQHTVAEVMAERVVDGLEIVYVNEEQSEALTGRIRPRQCATQPLRQLAAVGKLRERIVMCEVVELTGALGHVPFELCLVGAQFAFGSGDLRRHCIEGLGQRIDLC